MARTKSGKVSTQSEESKVIKRINEQMRILYEWIPEDDNTYLAAYHRAIRESGLQYSYSRDKKTGLERPVIVNSKENQAKVDILRKKLVETGARSKKEIAQEANEELRQSGIKATPGNRRAQMQIKAAYQVLTSNLTFAYDRERTNKRYSKYGDMLRDLSRKDNPAEYAKRVVKIAKDLTAERRRAEGTPSKWPELTKM